MAAKSRCLERRALRIEQSPDHPLYLFTLSGDELLQIADISRVSRDAAGKLLGYQRGEVKRHVDEIVEYLNSENVLFPNAIILALPSGVRFKKSRGPENSDELAVAGVLEIPIPGNGQRKPAWIVDGQQRAIALSRSRRKNFPVPVSAFVADDLDVQREQFLRVNSAKPLDVGLITELLPQVSTLLPQRMAARKMPSAICDWLSQNPKSPFHGLIRRPSMPVAEKKRAVIADTSVVKMIEESLSSPSGCLFPYRNIATGETDFDGICDVLMTYWTAVKNVFPQAWGKPPTKSRLMHGAGIRAMGRLMDRIIPTVQLQKADRVTQVERELRKIAPACRWVSGVWDELNGLKWNEIQNVPRHIHALSNLLIRSYVHPGKQG